jgi:Ca2+-binding EF-hand superfamily protein
MNHGQQYGTWDLPKSVGPSSSIKKFQRSNNASRLANEIQIMRNQPIRRSPPPPTTTTSNLVPPTRQAPSAHALQVPAVPRTATPSSNINVDASRSLSARSNSIKPQGPAFVARTSNSNSSNNNNQFLRSSGGPITPNSSSTTTAPPPRMIEPVPTSMGGSIPNFSKTKTNFNQSQNPADVVRDMRAAERSKMQEALSGRVKRVEDFRGRPSADSTRELHRRNSSPGYMAARVIQGVDWNRDAYLSQQAYNHAMSQARKMEASQVQAYHSEREEKWHTDVGGARKILDQNGRTRPQPCRGMIPHGSGAASKVESEYLLAHAGSSFVPEMEATLTGRNKDEDLLLRIFRSYDTRFDGTIPYSSFRKACRYLGIEQQHGRHAVDELAKRAGSDSAGNILYQNAIPIMEILPQPGTEQRDRIINGAVVPEGMRPRASDNNSLVGPLGDVGYLATSPWGSASSELAGSNEKALSAAMKAQMNPGKKTQEEIMAITAVKPLQERLLGSGGDKKGAAVRLKAALRNADRDRDGCIGYQDFKQTLYSKLNIELTPYEMEQVSRNFDAHGAGQIDYYQMVKALEASGEEQSRRNQIEKTKLVNQRRALDKVRESVRGKTWKFNDTFKRMDKNGDGIVTGDEVSAGLKHTGVCLTKEEDAALRKWVGDGVQAHEFIASLNQPVRSNDSQLEGAGPMVKLEEDPYGGRGKRIVYQGSDGSDFQRQYDYINSGFLTPEQRKEKILMHNIVSSVNQRGLEVYDKNGGAIMNVFRSSDPDNTGEISQTSFENCLSQLGIDNINRNDKIRLMNQFRGSSDNTVNYNEFFNVIKHEQNETMQRPHTSSQIGFAKGQFSTLAPNIPREKGKKMYSIKEKASDHVRSTMLDHHDSFGRSGQNVDLAENLHTSWIPRTQEELIKVRKISDVLSSSRDRLSRRFQSKDMQKRGVITNSDFISSVRQECGHLLREEDIRWLKDRVEDNSTGVVDYSNVVNVMKDNFVSSFYIF